MSSTAKIIPRILEEYIKDANSDDPLTSLDGLIMILIHLEAHNGNGYWRLIHAANNPEDWDKLASKNEG